MKKIVNAIKKAETIILVPHINPDADTLGSCYALKKAFEKLSKKCLVVAEDKAPDFISDYADGEYEIYEDGADYSCDLCLVVDCADLKRVGNRKALFSSAKELALIDHHPTNTEFAQINYVEATAPATAVIVYKLLELLEVNLDTDIARYLYAAIVGDTGNFKYSNVTPETFVIASKLISYDIKHWEISKAIFDTEDFMSSKIKAELTGDVKLYANGLIAVVMAKASLFEKYGMDEEEISDLVDIARRIRGCEVAVALKETKKGIKVSLRAANVCDVSKIAAVYGGGGHVRAAGLLVKDMKIEELSEKLVFDITNQLKELSLL